MGTFGGSKRRAERLETCKVCTKEFTTRASRVFYCSEQCSLKAAANRVGKPSSAEGVCTGSLGSAHELLVCADLLKRGWEVFRSVSSHASVDLIAHKNGVLKRVEVTTGSRKVDGGISHPTKDPARHDVLAIVLYSGEIVYRDVGV